jgi:hypothetical protein
VFAILKFNSVPFLSYEHQFWPAAVAAARNIVEGLRKGDPGSRKAIDHVLGRSATDRSCGLLRQAGIDLSKPEAYRAVLTRAKGLLK